MQTNYLILIHLPTVDNSCFNDMLSTVDRWVRIKYFLGTKVIHKAGFNYTFYYFRYERKVRGWTIVRE